METAQRICKRLHGYLRADTYAGSVSFVSTDRLDIAAPFGVVSVLRAGALQPFSCRVGGMQPFTATSIKPDMDVLLDENGIAVPEGDFSVDVTLAEDVDLAIEGMVNLFLPVDMPIRVRHIQQVIESYAGGEDLSALALSPEQGDKEGLAERMLALSAAFFDGDREQIARAAEAVSGFGSGQVAASDALLCGYMNGFSCLSYALGRSRNTVLSLTHAAADAAAAHTGESGALALQQAGEGVVAEDMFQVLRGLFSDIPYSSLVAWSNQTAQRSNGVNLLAGLCLSLQHLYLNNAF